MGFTNVVVPGVVVPGVVGGVIMAVVVKGERGMWAVVCELGKL